MLNIKVSYSYQSDKLHPVEMLFALCIVLVPFLILILIISWKHHQNLKRLKECNISVRQMPPLLYEFIRSFLPRGPDFNERSWAFQYVYSQYLMYKKERIYATSIAGMITVCLFKPEHIEVILNSNTVLDKGWVYRNMKPLLGNGLVTRSGKTWKPRRRILTPSFHFKILENFQSYINKHSFILIEKINKKSHLPWIDIQSMLSLCTLDIIAETAMGVEINAQDKEESQYVKAIKRIEELITTRNMKPWMWPDIIFYITPTGREFKEVLAIVHGFTRKVISEKLKEVEKDVNCEYLDDTENIYMHSKKRKAFLDLLLHNYIHEKNITLEEIREEVDTFMFAGHDTTSVGISWALYNIGLYPDIQQKLYEELYSIFGDDKERPVTTEDMTQMKYLDCVLKESFRLFPSIPGIVRQAEEDLKLNDKITIPKNSAIVIEIHSLHHDSENFPNPEVFDPDRFLPENSANRHPFSFIPFSAGPRNCIGQKFALMEEKIVISNILRHFWIKSLDPPDKIMKSGDIVLRTENKLRIEFRRKIA